MERLGKKLLVALQFSFGPLAIGHVLDDRRKNLFVLRFDLLQRDLGDVVSPVFSAMDGFKPQMRFLAGAERLNHLLEDLAIDIGLQVERR